MSMVFNHPATPARHPLSGCPLKQGGLSWEGFAFNAETLETLFRTQNVWKNVNGTDKWRMVKDHIENAKKYAAAGQITLNFASYTDNSVPGKNAQDMNNRLQRHLKNRDFNPPLGVIAIDFTGNTGDAGDSLENLIIQTQAHQKPNYSYGGIPQWLLKISS